MSIKFACVKCGKPGFALCPDCRDSPVSVVSGVDNVVKPGRYMEGVSGDDSDAVTLDVPVVAPMNKSVNKVVDKPAGRSVGDLPAYSRSVLHNKMGYNDKSIVNEVCCVKVEGGYVLNKDIIQWYRSRLGA